MWKTQGAYLDGWQAGVKLGAVKDGERLLVSLVAPAGWTGRLRFDYARHRRELNFARNYVRLNEWPEWFAVDENTLYRVTDAAGQGRDPPGLGAEGRASPSRGSGRIRRVEPIRRAEQKENGPAGNGPAGPGKRQPIRT